MVASSRTRQYPVIDNKEILFERNYRLNEINELIIFIKSLIDSDHSTLLFTGDLGAGKTTLIKQLLASLGVAEEVTSPTYTLINEYKDEKDKSIYHLDLYRLDSIEEALEIGIEDILYNPNLSLIEWPEVISPILPEGCIHIHIGHHSIESRSITIKEL